MASMRRTIGALALCGLIATGCSADRPDSAGDASASPSVSESGTSAPAPRAGEEQDAGAPPPISVLGLAQQRHEGSGLRIGAVRSQSAEYTSFDVRYRSCETTLSGGSGGSGKDCYWITGVLNVPS